ncbi:MAG: hypothetical protein WDN01_19720 [Rhizomicrobium sp.]
MLTYEPLQNYLSRQTEDVVALTFEDIERIIGAELPASAIRRNEWWSNNATGHSQAKAWLDAGFVTANLDRKGKTVVFRRASGRIARGGGLREEPAEFRSAMEADMNATHHPAFGAMKGTFTIEPGYDITKPVYTDEEWNEIESEVLAKFDRMFPGDAK